MSHPYASRTTFAYSLTLRPAHLAPAKKYASRTRQQLAPLITQHVAPIRISHHLAYSLTLRLGSAMGSQSQSQIFNLVQPIKYNLLFTIEYNLLFTILSYIFTILSFTILLLYIFNYYFIISIFGFIKWSLTKSQFRFSFHFLTIILNLSHLRFRNFLRLSKIFQIISKSFRYGARNFRKFAESH